jgi:hypothetical protein
MTAALPGHLFLPAAREIEQVREFMAASASTPGEVAGLDALRLSLLEGVAELERLPLEQAALDEWSRRVVRPLFGRASELFRLVSRPSFFAELDVAIEKQRGDLRVYLQPQQLDGQTDWALVTVHLYVNLMGDLLARMPQLTQQEIDGALQSVDITGPVGAGLRVILLLTFLLEQARASRPVTQRHAAIVALAYLNSNVLLATLRNDLNLKLDPTPFLEMNRVDAAKKSLLRLLKLPADPTDVVSADSGT